MEPRPPVPADAPAVLEVINARYRVDFGIELTAGQLRDEWALAAVDLTRDARVTQRGGAIVAYALARAPNLSVTVAPRAEGQGIGTELLAWGERRLREQGATLAVQRLGPDNRRGQTLLSAGGYRYERTYRRLARAVGDEDRLPVIPPGVMVRGIDVDADAAAVQAADEAAFAQRPDYNPMTPDAFREIELGGHDFSLPLSVVAEIDHRIVAYMLVRRWPQNAAYVNVLGTVPARQGQGLGTLLLRTGWAAAAAAGFSEVIIGVASDNPRAEALYRRLGFAQRTAIDHWVRTL